MDFHPRDLNQHHHKHLTITSQRLAKRIINSIKREVSINLVSPTPMLICASERLRTRKVTYERKPADSCLGQDENLWYDSRYSLVLALVPSCINVSSTKDSQFWKNRSSPSSLPPHVSKSIYVIVYTEIFFSMPSFMTPTRE